MTLVTDGGMTFAEYAAHIGKSRPYVSKLVAQGRISAPALTADRRILADLADAQVAEGADPARSRGVATGGSAEASYARERARKTAADAERAEIELKARKGELVERGAIAATLGPWLRQLRDDLLGVPRDHVTNAVEAAATETRIAELLGAFSARLADVSAEPVSHGGAAASG